jgi:hypothetical protein
MNRRLRRTFASLVVAAFLFLPCLARRAQALSAPAMGATASAKVEASAGAWWRNALVTLGILRPEVGCSLDPNGCRMRPAPTRRAVPQVGCSLDPDGCRMRPAPARRAAPRGGCSLDPSGCRM